MDEDRRFQAEWLRYRQRWKPDVGAERDRVSPGRILVVKLADIGDLLTITPSLRALRESFPATHISLLATPGSAMVLQGAPWVDEVITLDKRLFDIPHQALRPREMALALRMGRILRGSQFDATIILHHLLTWWGVVKYAALTSGVGAKIRLGLDDGRGWFYTHKALDGGFGYLHEVDYWLSTVGVIGARTQDRRLEMFISPQEDSAAGSLLDDCRQQPLIAIHPGSGTYSLARRWPVRRFAQVADGLIDAFGASIIIVGGPAEVGLATEMASQMKNRATNLAGKTTLKQLAAVLRRCSLFVGNDSGVMHVSVAVGTRVVGVFGPSNYRAWGPYFPDTIGVDEVAPTERSILVRATRPCSPCLYPNPYRANSRPCSEVHCLKDIEAAPVLQAARQLMETTHTKSIDSLPV